MLALKERAVVTVQFSVSVRRWVVGWERGGGVRWVGEGWLREVLSRERGLVVCWLRVLMGERV